MNKREHDQRGLALGLRAGRCGRPRARTTASSLLNESGLRHPDSIERALPQRDSFAIRDNHKLRHLLEWADPDVSMMELLSE